MTHTIQPISTHPGAGLTSGIIGLFYAFQRLGIKTGYYQPIEQVTGAQPTSQTTTRLMMETLSKTTQPAPVSAARTEQLLAEGKTDVLLEDILITYEKLKADNQVIVIGSLQESKEQPYATELNSQVAKAIGADIVLVTNTVGCDTLTRFEQKLTIATKQYGGISSQYLLGTIVNCIDDNPLSPKDITSSELFSAHFRLLAAVPHLPANDGERDQKTQQHFADHIDSDWCQHYLDSQVRQHQSPAAFKYQMVKSAQANKKTIVLPEGDEPRTIIAANTCVNRRMADCILLANPDAVKQVAESHGVTLNPHLRILDPEETRNDYIARLVELRQHKGMNEALAREQLADNVMLGTMMLEANQVDGLVSGAVHTTANTIRPPLQIIKTAPGSQLVSSIFFMCLPEQVLVYGDCAINPTPNAEQLAEIAIQSADSATAFGILPKVAMISYSTGTSGSGEAVDTVRTATELVRNKRPDICVDGPLQYDAATVASVAAKKAPNSPVAGQANVFIFPDLNTGNTTYKAVQRAADAIAIGPVLQGMGKPVNDLSRGALIDDIIYTIAITAIQASQSQSQH